MKLIHLQRSRAPECTPGRLQLGGFSCVTLEPPPLDNLPNVSCIPAGVYILKLGVFRKGNGGQGYPSYEFQKVPGRTLIETHSGNRVRNTLGCVLLGLRFGVFAGEFAVLDSTIARLDFMAVMGGQAEAVIEIADP